MFQFKSNQLAIGQIILVVTIWAGSFVAMKIAVAELGAFPTIFLRMLLAVALLVFFLPRITREKSNYQQGDWLLLLALILCEPCLYFVFEGLALSLTSASEAGMITALHPFMVTLAAYFWLKEKVTPRMLVGGLFALTGALLLTMGGDPTESDNEHLLGNLLEFIAIGFATAYCILARKLSARYSPLFLTTVQAIFGTVFFLPLALTFNQGMPAQISPETLFSILFLAWGVNVLAFILYNASLKAMPASQVGLWMNLLPLMTLLFGWLMLDERLNAIQYFSVALIISGLIVSQIKPRKKSLFIEQSAIDELTIDSAVTNFSASKDLPDTANLDYAEERLFQR